MRPEEIFSKKIFKNKNTFGRKKLSTEKFFGVTNFQQKKFEQKMFLQKNFRTQNNFNQITFRPKIILLEINFFAENIIDQKFDQVKKSLMKKRP